LEDEDIIIFDPLGELLKLVEELEKSEVEKHALQS
jgi:hypothetical protein